MRSSLPPAEATGQQSLAARFVAGTWSDLRHAVRLLWKGRGFASVTLLTLALCIGANTAIFSLVYGLMLKPLPYPNPDRIVEIYNTYLKAGLKKMPSNVVQYLDYKQNSASYEHVGLWKQIQVMLGEDGAAERVDVARATAEMFDVLGVRPVIGQFFTLQNSLPGEDKVIVLTQAFWRSHFREDPAVLGRTVRIDGETFTIIGVAQRSLEAFDARVKFVRPMAWPPDRINPQQRHSLNTELFARLKAGVSVGQAQAEADAVERRFYDQAPAGAKAFMDRAGHKIAVAMVQAERVQPVKTSLYLLQGGVVFVLLIGCVNVANLLLARANRRQGELAIRFALGAGRAAIARQLLIESLLLTSLGALLGLGLAWGAIHVINRVISQMLPSLLPFAIDERVLAFTVVLSLAVGVVMGLLPVVHVVRANLVERIHSNSRSASGGRGVRTLSSILVVGQVAFALVLLTGAGLLIHAFLNALAVNPNFDPKQVVTARMALPAAYRTEEKSRLFQQQLEQALREIPGVSAVATANTIPFQGASSINALTLKDSTLPPNSPQPGAYQVAVSRGYFEAMRIPLVEGRFFEEAEAAQPRRAYVVDERFAQKYFPGRSAVGGRFTFGGAPANESDWPTIVGVVRNVPHNGVEDTSDIPFVYHAILPLRPGGLAIFVRTSRPVADAISAIREKLRSLDSSIPLFETQSLQSVVDASFANRRAVMLLLVSFAGLALFLSAIGIYGVLAYDVSQRTREIGIRGAIGATRQQIVALILRQGLWKAGAGIVLGLVLAVLLSRYITTLLFNVKPTNPLAYAVMSLVLVAVAALASYLPARRAAKIDPIVALRDE